MTSPHSPAASHGDAAASGHGHGHGGEISPHGRRAHYIGSLLSIVLTVIPFWLVMSGVLHNDGITAAIIFVLAIAQIIVHVICFLHVDTKAEGGWTLISFIFTLVIVFLMAGGSIWVMYHLDANMMQAPEGSMARTH